MAQCGDDERHCRADPTRLGRLADMGHYVELHIATPMCSSELCGVTVPIPGPPGIWAERFST